MARQNANSVTGPVKSKFTVADKFQRQDPEHYETELTGDELDKFKTQRRNAYAIEHFMDPANVMIIQN